MTSTSSSSCDTRRELQTLKVQGLTDLLGRVATIALPIDELGD